LWNTALSTPPVNGLGVDISKKMPNFMPPPRPARRDSEDRSPPPGVG
jgi:hypothetical protein